jgi:RNA polymerase primary sigma factor
MSSIETSFGQGGPRDVLGEYLSNIGRFPLLEPQDEVELARCIEVGVIAQERLSSQPDTPDALLLRQLISEGARAHDRFVRANLRLVVSIAKRYSGLGLPLMDLVQEGNIGLDRAVKKFDYTKGFKFSTYATWWIRQAITRGLAESARLVRIPVRVAESVSTIRRQHRDLEATLGREPSLEELALASGHPLEKVQQLLDLDRQPVSLSLPLGDDADGAVLGDLIEDDGDSDVVEIVSGSLRLKALHESLSELPPRDADVLRKRYGLDGNEACTLDELSVEFSISRERVRQIEQRGLRALRARQFRDRLAD